MAIREIRVEDAAVRTASVEIKSLIVSGKQMTLAVFRQIPERDWLDPLTCEPRGVAWGRVNYYWGDQLRFDIHMVWQEGDRLYRSLVTPHFSVPSQLADNRAVARTRISNGGHLVLIDRLLAGDIFEWEGALGARSVTAGTESTWVRFVEGGEYPLGAGLASLRFTLSPDAHWRGQQYHWTAAGKVPFTEEERKAYEREKTEEAHANLREMRAATVAEVVASGYEGQTVDPVPLLAWAIIKLKEVDEAVATARRAFHNSIETLREIDQLYIAV